MDAQFGVETAMAKYLAQAIAIAASVVGRAFARALRQEVEASRQAAAASGRSRASQMRDVAQGLSLNEAQQILNVDQLERELVERNYKHLFDANEKAAGGSFYLQSKVVRARERLLEELDAKPPDKPERKQ